MTKYLSIKDYIKVALAFLPIWIFVIMTLSLITGPIDNDTFEGLFIIVSLLITFSLLYFILNLKAKIREKELKMIWIAEENYKNNELLKKESHHIDDDNLKMKTNELENKIKELNIEIERLKSKDNK